MFTRRWLFERRIFKYRYDSPSENEHFKYDCLTFAHYNIIIHRMIPSVLLNPYIIRALGNTGSPDGRDTYSHACPHNRHYRKVPKVLQRTTDRGCNKNVRALTE